MIKTRGYATHSPTSPLTPFAFERREPGPHDVQIEILYCGICHTDLHQARNHWGGSMYPMVPGHEIVGRVTRVGAQVTKVKVDDYAGVGCMVDSCRRCSACNEGLEQYCEEGPTWTYNAKERGSEQLTFGGYSERVVVEERFVVKVPGSLDMKAVAPLFCAGITTYSPLRHWKVGRGQRIGVIGLGGLGHMGVKFAKAFGAAGGHDHHFAGQGPGCHPPRRRRGAGVERPGGDGQAGQQLPFPAQHHPQPARRKPLPGAAEARWHDGAGRGFDRRWNRRSWAAV